MLSSRGAITTNVALVECAAGQNTSGKNVFLLSELEKVWVAVAVVARRLLLDGSAAQIAPFCTLWTKDYILLRDRQHKTYTTRKLCFGINHTYANRYGVDTSKVPLERPDGSCYVRISIADIVAVCGVPAKTASAALKDFFLYLGEGLSRGRVFQLSLPGVAMIAIKRQKVVLTMKEELRIELYKIDSRRWPGEIQREGYDTLQALMTSGTSTMPNSAVSSRPSTSQLTRTSWRAPSSTAASGTPRGSGAEEKKPVFVAAAPTGRLFEEIAQQEEQRRNAAQAVAAVEKEMRRRQEELDRRIERHYAYEYHADPTEYDAYSPKQSYIEDEGDVRTSSVCEGEEERVSHWRRPTSGSGESIYNSISPPDARRVGTSHTEHFQYGGPCGKASATHHRTGVTTTAAEEPDVEVIEIDNEEESRGKPSAPATNVPFAPKDAELERVLRAEEPFSRPISRRAYHDSTAARDLIYSARSEQKASTAAAKTTVGAPPHMLGMHSRTHIEKNSPTPASQESSKASAAIANDGETQQDVYLYGRKRFDSNSYNDDHVGGLLRYREY